ncbi:MAG TPA: hypothetical protein P5137_04700 [Candidatus Brocadiia bacterium]|nr:hypothetical protein [Candidatus Brocadiia bacterium]
MPLLALDIPRRAIRGLAAVVAGTLLVIGQAAVSLFRLSPRQYFMLAIAIGLLVLAAAQMSGVDRMRDTLRVPTAMGELTGEGAQRPEIVLLRHMLGGFKVIAIDIVWLRANKLIIDKQFWELHQLYDWIGKLAPRLEEVWVFNGWNMAYNIVAEISDPEGRWSWIARAIEWMRDEGLKYNPRSARICREIAWVYAHKIGGDVDEYQTYYKHRLALNLDRILGDLKYDWVAVKDYPRDLKGLAEYNRDVERFMTALGRTRDTSDPAAQRAYAERLLQSLDKEDFYDRLPAELRKMMEKPEHEAARMVLRGYLAAKSLRKIYKLDVKRMARIQTEYRPMDWRLPDSHAIYWSDLGRDIILDRVLTPYMDAYIEEVKANRKGEAINYDLARQKLIEVAKGRPDLVPLAKDEAVDELVRNFTRGPEFRELKRTLADKTIDLDRIIFSSLKALYRRGVIVYMDPVPNGQIMLTYDMSRIEQLHDMYVEAIAQGREVQEELDRVWRERRKLGFQEIPKDMRGLESTRDGHIYFLQEVSENLYYSGQYKRAMKYFEYGQKHYDKFKKGDGSFYTLDEYCLGKVKDLVTLSGKREQVQALVEGFILHHLLFYASHVDDMASSWAGKAQEIWRYYVDDAIQRAQARRTVEDLALPTFEQLYRSVVRDILLRRKPFPPELLGRLRSRFDLPDDWEKNQLQNFFQKYKESEKSLRDEAYRKAVEPLPTPKEKSAVEEEQERRKREEEAAERAKEHRSSH